MPLIEKNIAKRIERMRISKKAKVANEHKYLSKKELAEILYMNTSDYDFRLTGKIPFSVKSLNIVSKIYDADINYILFGGIK